MKGMSGFKMVWMFSGLIFSDDLFKTTFPERSRCPKCQAKTSKLSAVKQAYKSKNRNAIAPQKVATAFRLLD